MSWNNFASTLKQLRPLFILCGIASALIYIATDIVGAIAYQGYSYRDQAVSELFAIGAPTTWLVVPLFSLSSFLLLAFSLGVWLSSKSDRWRQTMALMFLGSAVVGLLIWLFFPMHMRGAEPTFTDTMHLVLATNPFVLLSLVAGAMSFRKRFRCYSIVVIVILFALAVPAFLYAPQVAAGQPTPWLGIAERGAQYTYLVWQSTLAFRLLRIDRAHQT